MKLSEILGWPEQKEIRDTFYGDCEQADYAGFNEALTSCDREIDREALAKEIYKQEYRSGKWHEWHESSLAVQNACLARADKIISTMPTWLKRIEK